MGASKRMMQTKQFHHTCAIFCLRNCEGPHNSHMLFTDKLIRFRAIKSQFLVYANNLIV